MDLMRDHYEGEWMDSSSDVGAQAFHLSYRWDPLVWAYGVGSILMNMLFLHLELGIILLLK